MTEGNYYTDEEKVEQLEAKLAALGNEYAIVCHFKQENEDLKREVAKLRQEGLESNDAHESAFFKKVALMKALDVAAKQLEDVAIALEVHGQRINVQWFIEEYRRNADQARAALG